MKYMKFDPFQQMVYAQPRILPRKCDALTPQRF